MQADQVRATAREYIQALKDGLVPLASRIMKAAVEDNMADELIKAIVEVKREEGIL